MRELYREFLEDRYQPKPALRVFIPKSDGRQRPLGIPTVKDRIAQAAVRGILEPIYEKEFCDCSFGFRKGKLQIDAINQIEEYKEQGYKWVLDADIKGFFDNIDHELLIEFIKQKVTDGWANYFGHGNVKTLFRSLDKWIRMRLTESCIRENRTCSLTRGLS